MHAAEWGPLTLMLLAAAVLWFWQDSLAARESANAAAKEACTRLGLQFLDGTVAFARLALVRVNGWLQLRRTYVFDYTATSIERRQGFVLLTGRRVESIGYAPGETQTDAALVRGPNQSRRTATAATGQTMCWSCATGASGKTARTSQECRAKARATALARLGHVA